MDCQDLGLPRFTDAEYPMLVINGKRIWIMDFKENAKNIPISDFWYDITRGGLHPRDILKRQQDITKIEAAIDILRNFEFELETKGIVEYN